LYFKTVFCIFLLNISAVLNDLNFTKKNETNYEGGNGDLTTFQSNFDEIMSDLTSKEEDIWGQLESHYNKRKNHLKQRAIDIESSLNQIGCSNFNLQEKEIGILHEIIDIILG